MRIVRFARPLVWPLRLGVHFAGGWDLVAEDIDHWVRRITNPTLRALQPEDQFVWLTIRHSEFRTLVHYRNRGLPLLVRVALSQLYRPRVSLDIECENIGAGLFIQHGFATTITAERIGRGCWINQQVTIGHNSKGCPTIGDHVRIAAGAVVVGAITVHDGATIGANATVVDDVAAGDVLVSPKAISIRNRMN